MLFQVFRSEVDGSPTGAFVVDYVRGLATLDAFLQQEDRCC